MYLAEVDMGHGLHTCQTRFVYSAEVDMDYGLHAHLVRVTYLAEVDMDMVCMHARSISCTKQNSFLSGL